MAQSSNTKAPPRHGYIFMGYLVIRKFGTPGQYETWIPDHAIEGIYAPA
jgi:hypothetical protein